jgi:hypothetical protein
MGRICEVRAKCEDLAQYNLHILKGIGSMAVDAALNELVSA